MSSWAYESPDRVITGLPFFSGSLTGLFEYLNVHLILYAHVTFNLRDYSLRNIVSTSLGLPGHFFPNFLFVGLVLFLCKRLFLAAASWVCMRPISYRFCGDSSHLHSGSWLGLLAFSVMPSPFLTPPKRDLPEVKVGTVFQVRGQ